MTPRDTESRITAEFRDHKSEELCDELIGTKEFFAPEDFKIADHHISGKFDHYGQFSGTVAIYGQPPIEHVVPWPPAQERKQNVVPSN